MAVLSNITFGTLSISSVLVSARRAKGTIKHIMGTDLVEDNIPERTVKDWVITITGEFIGANIGADRSTLSDYDDLTVVEYTDGEHDGNYIIMPNTLVITDNKAKVGAIVDFQFTIKQYQQ